MSLEIKVQGIVLHIFILLLSLVCPFHIAVESAFFFSGVPRGVGGQMLWGARQGGAAKLPLPSLDSDPSSPFISRILPSSFLPLGVLLRAGGVVHDLPGPQEAF